MPESPHTPYSMIPALAEERGKTLGDIAAEAFGWTFEDPLKALEYLIETGDPTPYSITDLKRLGRSCADSLFAFVPADIVREIQNSPAERRRREAMRERIKARQDRDRAEVERLRADGSSKALADADRLQAHIKDIERMTGL